MNNKYSIRARHSGLLIKLTCLNIQELINTVTQQLTTKKRDPYAPSKVIIFEKNINDIGVRRVCSIEYSGGKMYFTDFSIEPEKRKFVAELSLRNIPNFVSALLTEKFSLC